MKAILTILILFIGLSAIGQNQDTLPIRTDYHFIKGGAWGYDKTGMRIPADTVKPNKEVWRTSTEWLILKYADECFNDSTFVHTHTAKWNDGCYAQSGNMADGYYFELVCEDKNHFEWTRKKPTFEGFIEWLKQRE